MSDGATNMNRPAGEINPALQHAAEQQNYYVVHLAEVNKKNDVVSTQDIYNTNGLLIVPKNTSISHSIAERVLQHKLLKPIENQIQFTNEINCDSMKQDTDALLDKYPDLTHIHTSYGFNKTLDQIFSVCNIPSLVMQKLTVMRERLPNEYEKSLFCAWLSALIAQEARMQEEHVHAAYTAGLTHDMGLLHISPDILSKKGKLTVEEWRAIQCHVIVGYMLLKNVGTMHQAVAQSVIEHHERCDGSGYPTGRTDDELDLLGQVIGMADSLQAIRINQFAKCGRNLRDALPYLHMNSHAHFLVTYKAMCSVLLKSNIQPSRANPLGTIKALVSHLVNYCKKLQNVVALLEEVLTLSIEAGSPCRKIVKVVKPVVIMIHSSGLMKKEILNWLEILQDDIDEIVLEELVEMELMQNELRWQLKRANKVINAYTEGPASADAPELKERIMTIMKQIEAVA
jgi:HD-GYP domain-containing protein (c-di-GMP phosphodiesterase class II)